MNKIERSECLIAMFTLKHAHKEGHTVNTGSQNAQLGGDAAGECRVKQRGFLFK